MIMSHGLLAVPIVEILRFAQDDDHAIQKIFNAYGISSENGINYECQQGVDPQATEAP